VANAPIENARDKQSGKIREHIAPGKGSMVAGFRISSTSIALMYGFGSLAVLMYLSMNALCGRSYFIKTCAVNSGCSHLKRMSGRHAKAAMLAHKQHGMRRYSCGKHTRWCTTHLRVIEIKAGKDQRQQAEAEAHVAAAILHDVNDQRLETGRRQARDGVVDKVAPRLRAKQ
jgi:hypothetical protein